MKRFVITYFLILISIIGLGQNGYGSYRFWNQTSISGAVTAGAYFRNQQRILENNYEEYIQGTLLTAGLLLESSSFIAHPNLLKLDVGVEFNPEKRFRQFSTIPNRSEVYTLGRLDIRTTLFQEKQFTVNAFVNLNQNIINRENLTSSRTNRAFWGGGFNYRNKVLPFLINYQEGSWEQVEIETGRTYSYWQRNIRGEASKSFYNLDKHILTYSYDDYINKQYYASELHNQIHFVELTSTLPFSSKKNYNLNTNFSNLSQRGTNDFNRFQALLNVNMQLPGNFTLNGSYNYFDQQYPLFWLDQHRGKINIGHQLFQSLRTNVFANYSLNKSSLYTENDSRIGFNVNYTKKLSFGRLNINYMYFHRVFSRQSELAPINIKNEEHVLKDGEITLLDKPFIEEQTVVVKDITGIIIYQLNVDYILIIQNDFIEIKRLPGGMISNNSSVYVDYTATLPGSYAYQLNNQAFSASILLFKNFLEIYYLRRKQNFKDVQYTDYIPLNYYLQNIYGVRFTFGAVRFGVEYDRFKSTITPYELVRFYGNINWRLNKKLLISFIGNVRYYLMIAYRENELYADISGKMAYSFSKQTKLNVELGYRDDKGYQIDLNLFVLRSEFVWIVRKIDITVGVEVYRRNYLNQETINFNGAYVSFIRKF